MNYRIRFRKVTKWQKFKDCIKGLFDTIKTFFGNRLSGVKIFSQKVKSFNDRINYQSLFNKIGIFILFLIPIFVCLILCLYSLIWVGMLIAEVFGQSWKQLADIMPLSAGSIALNLIIVYASFKSMIWVITSALDNLNGDLSSIKLYLLNCIYPMLISGIIYFVLLYKPAYNFICDVLQCILIIIAIGFVLMILGKIFCAETEEYDIIQIKLPKR